MPGDRNFRGRLEVWGITSWIPNTAPPEGSKPKQEWRDISHILKQCKILSKERAGMAAWSTNIPI